MSPSRVGFERLDRANVRLAAQEKIGGFTTAPRSSVVPLRLSHSTGRCLSLRAEAKVHDVAVLHDVVLAFEPHFANLTRAGLAAASDIIVI
jgi:hypothetical protein